MEDKLFVFNYKQNRDKLIANLISIIDGILADGIVNEAEILYLDTWLLEAKQIEKNASIKLLKYRIESVFRGGKVSEDELLDIKDLLPKIQRELMGLPEIDLYSVESDVHLLTGLCKGLVADKSLSEAEVRYLAWWLTQNGALKNNYPGKHLYNLVKEILEDEKITQEESEKLHSAITAFTGSDLESGIVEGLSTRFPIDDIEIVSIEGKRFCLTGEFFSGKRSSVTELIEKSGGIVQEGINKKLDFLVIGLGSSRDWRYTSHGRKIEKAINYRDEHSIPLKIIGEETLAKFLPTT